MTSRLSRFEIEEILKDVTGGTSPDDGDVLVFDKKTGWRFGAPGEDGILPPESGGTGLDEAAGEGEVLVGDGEGGYTPVPVSEVMGSQNLDGGSASSVYLVSQSIDGGGA